MSGLVIYATKKGSAEIYAKAFAKNNDYQLFKQDQVSLKDILDVERIYYFGSVYAGKVLGLEELKKKLPDISNLTVISVGLTSNNDQERLAEIREGIVKEFPQADFFHLRGSLAKDQLSLPEKLIIKMISKASKKKPDQEKLDIEKAIEQVASEGSVDCIDLAELENIS